MAVRISEVGLVGDLEVDRDVHVSMTTREDGKIRDLFPGEDVFEFVDMLEPGTRIWCTEPNFYIPVDEILPMLKELTAGGIEAPLYRDGEMVHTEETVQGCAIWCAIILCARSATTARVVGQWTSKGMARVVEYR